LAKDNALPKDTDVGKKIYEAGQKIANAGDTGASQGIHLHFELMRTPSAWRTGYMERSYCSINPLGLYCGHDKRDTSNPVYNPAPFFVNYKFNPGFAWNFDDANCNWEYKANDDIVKGRYSHHNSYIRN